MSADTKTMTAQAAALKADGRLEEAIALYERIVACTPISAVAEHNLASALSSAGRWREASVCIGRAFAKRIDAPESWLLRARCDQSLGRLDEAEAGFEQALRRRPMFYDALNELAQLRWMRGGDLPGALAHLEAAIRQTPTDTQLLVIKARVLEYAGRPDEAYALLSAVARVHPRNAVVLAAGSQLAADLGKADDALALAERAAGAAPNDPVVAVTLISACLASGHAARAAELAEALRQRAPNDQHAIALQATAWRLLGDPRYAALYDYGAFVTAETLDTPEGWPDLPAYLADLAAALKRSHSFATHPFNQSIRHGSQLPDVLHLDDPAAAALPRALDGPIRRTIAKIGTGDDVLRRRNRGGYAFQGMWSIRMSAGGFHIDHVHQKGWLSSALYVEVPDRLEGKQGWLKFGEPGVRTMPALEAEYFIEPAPGRLALFPSYMWHGTVPFTAPQPRMTVAFDMAPA